MEKIPGKGEGMVANRLIGIGTCIIEEPFLFSVPIFNTISAITATEARAVKTCTDRLGGVDSRVFKQLYTLPPDERTYHEDVHRFLLNCLAGPKARRNRTFESQMAIFPKMSRLNHSCFPNACYDWDEQKQKGTLHALMDIPQRTEITISYIANDAWCDTAERRETLRSTFHFDCRCELCGEDNDVWRTQRRADLRQRHRYLRPIDEADAVPPRITAISHENTTICAEKYLELLVQELGGPCNRPAHPQLYGLPRIMDSRLATA